MLFTCYHNETVENPKCLYTTGSFWLNLNFLHNSQWIIFPIQACLLLYVFLHLLFLFLLSFTPLEFFTSVLADGFSLSLKLQWKTISWWEKHSKSKL